MAKSLAKQSKTKLFLLDPPVPADEFCYKLWGALVKDVYKPTDYFSSHKNQNPISLVSSIKPQISPIEGYQNVVNSAKHGDVRAKLQGMVHAFWKGEWEGDRSRKSTRAEFWNMTAPMETLRDLMQNEEYKKNAMGFIEKHILPNDELYFVTAMLTLADMEHRGGVSQAMSAGGGVAIPNKDGSAAVEIAAGGGSSGSAVVSGKFQETTIMAIGYHQVSFRKLKGCKAWLKRLLGKPSKVIQSVTAIGDNAVYELSMEDSMVEGDVPVLGSKDEVNGEDEETDGGAESLKVQLQVVNELPFEIYSSYRDDDRHVEPATDT